MQRGITGYHQDAAGDWVAELSCGHDQHVRHRPPFEERPWVQSPEGRLDRLGAPLECPPCDRAEAPATLRLVRTGPEWTEQTLPAGLRRRHRLRPGTWGRLRVHDGRLGFSMAGEPPVEVELAAGAEQLIPPETDHEVQPIDGVRVSLDLLAVDRHHDASTRSPTDEGGDPACWAGSVCPDCGAMTEGSGHRPGCPDAEPA